VGGVASRLPAPASGPPAAPRPQGAETRLRDLTSRPACHKTVLSDVLNNKAHPHRSFTPPGPGPPRTGEALGSGQRAMPASRIERPTQSDRTLRAPVRDAL